MRAGVPNERRPSRQSALWPLRTRSSNSGFYFFALHRSCNLQSMSEPKWRTPEGAARRKAYWKEWYQKNRAHHIAKSNRISKEQRLKRRKVLDEIKSVPCAECKVQYPPWVMQFDHVRGIKVAEVPKLAVNRQVKWSRVEEEIAKCEIVCANCHADRTHRRAHSDNGSTSRLQRESDGS